MDYRFWLNPEASHQGLETMLAKPLLRFNPYRVSDDELLSMARQGKWGDEYDLTQMVIMKFGALRSIDRSPYYDGIYVRIGMDENEIFLSRSRLLYRITARDSLRQVRNRYGKRSICNDEDVMTLAGKTVFVSRLIHGRDFNGSGRVAYRMHRLWGKLEKDAAIIREAMCEAKIEMLQRQIEMIDAINVNHQRIDLLPYKDRILHAIARIRNYSSVSIAHQ